MFSRLGVDVTICCRSRLLPEMDPEVSAALKNYLEAEGVRVCAGVGYQRIAQTQSGVELTCEGHCDTVAAEQVLIATGRRPNSDGLGRSEEHTSELQSLMRISYAVFCLKKTNTTEQQ